MQRSAAIRMNHHVGALTACVAMCLACLDSIGCRGTGVPSESRPPAANAVRPKPPANPFDDYMVTEYAPADGFDFPVADAARGPFPPGDERRPTWRLSVPWHAPTGAGPNAGEDWTRGAVERAPQDNEVRSIGNGRVVLVMDSVEEWGKTVVVEHALYENEKKRTVQSLYGYLVVMHVSDIGQMYDQLPRGAMVVIV